MEKGEGKGAQNVFEVGLIFCTQGLAIHNFLNYEYLIRNVHIKRYIAKLC